MKKIAVLLLALMIAFSLYTGTIKASHVITSGDFECIIQTNGTVEITNYNGNKNDVTIPDKLDNYTVTSIGARAFRRNEHVSYLTIPNSVTSIGDLAFAGSKIEKLRMSSSLQNIGDGAFFESRELEEVYLPDGLTSIGRSAFKDCINIKTLRLPDSVNSIGEGAFYGCSSLESLQIPQGVTKIKKSTFAYCKELKNLIFPEGLEEIGIIALKDCESITNLKLPESLRTIRGGAFLQCTSLSEINIPESVTEIELTGLDHILYDPFVGCAGNLKLTVTLGSFGATFAETKDVTWPKNFLPGEQIANSTFNYEYLTESAPLFAPFPLKDNNNNDLGEFGAFMCIKKSGSTVSDKIIFKKIVKNGGNVTYEYLDPTTHANIYVLAKKTYDDWKMRNR